MAITNDSAGQVQLSPEEALERVLPELQKLSRSQLKTINLDPFAITAKVQGALPRILELRPYIKKSLVEFDLCVLDDLDVYALALIQCHAIYLSLRAPPEELSAVIEEASRLRKLLSAEVNIMIRRGLIKGLPAKGIRRNKAYKSIASDILTYVNLLRVNWDSMRSKCAFSKAELSQAEALGLKLLQLLGYSERPPREIAIATRQRQRAFTLFVDKYDDVRQAVNYVRWKQGDAERIAPSLYSGKHFTRKSQTPPEAETLPAVTPEQDPFLK
jgi:hypothetical protein